MVSEETGSISLAHRGRILRRISADKLENVLLAFYQQQAEVQERADIRSFFNAILKITRRERNSMNSLKRYTRNLSSLAPPPHSAGHRRVGAGRHHHRSVVKRNYSHAVGLEVTGLDSSLLITSKLPEQISMTLSAPESVWNSELSNTNVIRAVLDVSAWKPATIPYRLN